MTVRRTSSQARVLDLTRRLAEDFDTVPLPVVSQTMRDVVENLEPTGTTGDSIDIVERRVRTRLRLISQRGPKR